MNDGQTLKDQLYSQIVLKQSKYDLVTITLFITTTIIYLATLYALFIRVMPWWLNLIISFLYVNLSFTFWHEASHENLSPNRRLNEIFGIISSFFSLYPGYFARKREHLIHHRYEGTPGKDPVYYRIQKTNLFHFFYNVLKVNYFPEHPLDQKVVEALRPSGRELIIDRLIVGLNALICLFLIFIQRYDVLLSAFILPRLLVLVAHAYIICFFPHYTNNGDGFTVYRTYRPNFLFRFISAEQSYHGIHHYFPSIRWYNYHRVYNNFHHQFESSKIEIK